MYNKKLGTSIENAILKNKNDIDTLHELVAHKQISMPDVGYYANNIATEYINIGNLGDNTYFTTKISYPWYYNNRLYFFDNFTDTSKIQLTSINLADNSSTTVAIPSTLALTTSNYRTFELYPDSKGKLYVYLAGTSLYEYDFVNNTNTVIDISSFNANYRLIYTGDTLFLYNGISDIKKYENSAWVDAGLALEEYFTDTYTQDDIKGDFAFFQIFDGLKYIITMDSRYMYKYLCLESQFKMVQLECKFPKGMQEPQLSGNGLFVIGYHKYMSQVLVIYLKTNEYVIFQADGVSMLRMVKNFPGIMIQHYKTKLGNNYTGMGETFLVRHKPVDNKIWVGTQTEYDAITTKDPDIIYIIKEG